MYHVHLKCFLAEHFKASDYIVHFSMLAFMDMQAGVVSWHRKTKQGQQVGAMQSEWRQNGEPGSQLTLAMTLL